MTVMELFWAIVFACKLSTTSCAMLKSPHGFASAEACRAELPSRIAAVKVNLQVTKGWRIIGYCGLPLGQKEKA